VEQQQLQNASWIRLQNRPHKITNKYLLAVKIIIFTTPPAFCFIFCYERASTPNFIEAKLNEHFKQDNGRVCLDIRSQRCLALGQLVNSVKQHEPSNTK